jgi:hypothetical protein
MATGLEQQLIKGARFAAGPVVPIGSIAAAGFEKGQKKVKAEQLAKQQADFERRKLEAENYKNRLKSQDKILDNLFKNRTKAKVNADLLKGYWGEANIRDSEAIKLSEAGIKDLVKSGKISNSEALTMQREQVNDRMDLAVQRADGYSAFAEVVDNIRGTGVSSSVPSESIDEVNAILLGDSKAITAISKKYDIPPEDLLSEDALEKIGFKAADSGTFENVFSTVITAADSAASKGKSLENYKQDIQTAVSSMKLSDEQVQSVAFDYLGKQLPEYTEQYKTYLDAKDTEGLIKAVGDLNADGEASEEDLRIFITNQMVEAGEAAYEGYKKDYADKFEPKSDPKPTAAEQSKIEMKESAEEQVQNFFKDKSVWLRTKFGPNFEMKDTVVEFENDKYDLDRKEDIIRLIRNHGTAPGGIKGAEFDMAVQDAVNERRAKRLSIDEFN